MAVAAPSSVKARSAIPTAASHHAMIIPALCPSIAAALLLSEVATATSARTTTGSPMRRPTPMR